MEPKTVSGDRTASGGNAVVGLAFAFGFLLVGVIDRANGVAWAFAVVLVPIGALFGIRGLIEVIAPAELQMTQAGFVIKRALQPSLKQSWSEVALISVLQSYMHKRDVAYYEKRDGDRRTFKLPGLNSYKLVELMNDYRDRAIAPRATAYALSSAAPGFGHKPA